MATADEPLKGTLPQVTPTSVAPPGGVSGPGSTTDHALVRWASTDGSSIQNSGIIVDDSGNITSVGSVDGRDVSTDGTKLDTIETNATVDQTDAEIETAYNSQVGQVSSGEKTAGTETGVRRFAPKDVADMAGTHGGGGVTDHGALTGLADDDHSIYALADGTRPGWTASSSAPGSPSNGDAWFRTTAPQKLFIYDSGDSRWYASETITVTNNRGGTMAGGEWLGSDRLNALSNNARGEFFPFKVHWYSAIITSTATASVGSNVLVYINGVNVHSVDWTGLSSLITESLDETQAVGTSVRFQVSYTSGTAPANPRVFLHGREYV